jgi:hypothetical protein
METTKRKKNIEIRLIFGIILRGLEFKACGRRK